MERDCLSIEEVITSAQGSTNDFFIKSKFQVMSKSKKIASNGTPYYHLTLKYKTGQLKAKRFTSGDLEFDSLSAIYLEGNIIDIEGKYQNEWQSMKIFNEKLIESIIEDVSDEKYNKNGELYHKRTLALLQDQNEKIDELVNLNKFRTTISIKSHINNEIKPIFDNPSNRKIRNFKKYYKEHIDFWPVDRQNEVLNDYYRTIRRYEVMQSPRWKRWCSRLIKLIAILR